MLLLTGYPKIPRREGKVLHRFALSSAQVNLGDPKPEAFGCETGNIL